MSGIHMEEYRVSVAGQEVVVTRHGENDYDVFFEDDDYSVRGTFEDVVDAILASAEAEWRRVAVGF